MYPKKGTPDFKPICRSKNKTLKTLDSFRFPTKTTHPKKTNPVGFASHRRGATISSATKWLKTELSTIAAATSRNDISGSKPASSHGNRAEGGADLRTVPLLWCLSVCLLFPVFPGVPPERMTPRCVL